MAKNISNKPIRPFGLAQGGQAQGQPTTMEELLASLPQTSLNLVRGQIVSGEVVSVLNSEVILDLGTKSEGVIPIRDFPEGKLPKVGDKLEAFVIEPENESSQIILSLHQAQAKSNRDQRSSRELRGGPSAADFVKLTEKYNSDDTYSGTITKVSEFGVFVKLEDQVGSGQGLEGLIHESKIPANTKYETGQKISVMVDSVEPEKRRISLSPVVTSTKDLIYK